MQHGHRVIGLAIAQGRLVADLLCGADRGFVQAMAQAAFHVQHVQLSARRKHHLQKHLAFELQLARFLGINGIGLGNDFDREQPGLGLGMKLCLATLGLRTRIASSFGEAGNLAFHATTSCVGRE